MCARLCLFGSPPLGLPLPPDWEPAYNIAPTELLPTVIRQGNQLVARVMVWGWRPAWSKHPILHARAETVLEKPMFRGAMKSRRCVILASGFFEWQGEPGHRQPFYTHVPHRPVFGIPGLYMTSEETNMYEAVAITTEPDSAGAIMHPRMPVILTESDIELFLTTDDLLEAHSMLMMPYPDEMLERYPVAKAVGNARWKSPECITRMSE